MVQDAIKIWAEDDEKAHGDDITEKEYHALGLVDLTADPRPALCSIEGCQCQVQDAIEKAVDAVHSNANHLTVDDDHQDKNTGEKGTKDKAMESKEVEAEAKGKGKGEEKGDELNEEGCKTKGLTEEGIAEDFRLYQLGDPPALKDQVIEGKEVQGKGKEEEDELNKEDRKSKGLNEDQVA
ncbi:hypothetical protein KCU73_g550, partial [Aureobasidium melanogenum]